MLLSCVLGGQYSHKSYGWPSLLCCRSLVPTHTCSTNEDKSYQAFKRSDGRKSAKSWATEVNSGPAGVDGSPEPMLHLAGQQTLPGKPSSSQTTPWQAEEPGVLRKLRFFMIHCCFLQCTNKKSSSEVAFYML